MTEHKIEFIFPAGDQIDFECDLRDAMIKRATDNPEYAFENRWGEFFCQQGNIIHGVQWSYIGLENTKYDDAGNPIGEWYWEDEEFGPDFEVGCSWHEEEL
jgi:hypothetical protein